MVKEVDPKDTSRAVAYELWMKAPNPMVTFFKTLDVTNFVKVSKKRKMKFNMLLDYCIGKAAAEVKEFYILPVGDKLLQYDRIAVNTIIKNKNEEINSCDIYYQPDLEEYNKQYLKYTSQAAEGCQDQDLSENCMVIGTSAIIDTEIDGAVGMNSGIFNNPFMIWGRYKKKWFRYELPLSFQFHHTQMDGAHAGTFLANLQRGRSTIGAPPFPFALLQPVLHHVPEPCRAHLVVHQQLHQLVNTLGAHRQVRDHRRIAPLLLDLDPVALTGKASGHRHFAHHHTVVKAVDRALFPLRRPTPHI